MHPEQPLTSSGMNGHWAEILGFSITQGLLSTGKTSSGTSRHQVCSRKYACDVSIEKRDMNTDRSSSTVSLVYCCSCYSPIVSKLQDDHRRGICHWNRQNMSLGKQTCLLFILSKASFPLFAM